MILEENDGLLEKYGDREGDAGGSPEIGTKWWSLEKETSKKVFELMSKGVDFRVVGRKSIIIL